MDYKMDIIKIRNSLTKLEIYKNNQFNNMISFKSRLKKLSSTYSSYNVNKLGDVVTSITNKFEILKKNNINNIFVVNKNISKYLDTTKLVSKKFEDII